MKKFISILLSFMLLASHMSLAVGTHFCGGEAIETKIMLGDAQLDCGMPDMEEPCEDSEKSNTHEVHFENVPCCENEYQTFQVTGEFVKNVAPQSFSIDFASGFIYANPDVDLFPKLTHQFNAEYISPPLEKDIQVLFQAFLI